MCVRRVRAARAARACGAVELKLRADGVADYNAWIAALRPFAASFTEEDESMRSEPPASYRGGEGDDDDSD